MATHTANHELNLLTWFLHLTAQSLKTIAQFLDSTGLINNLKASNLMTPPTVPAPPAPPALSIKDSSWRYAVGRIFCIGRNYRAHSLEMGGKPDSEAPFFFMKPASAAVCSPTLLDIPSGQGEVHHEIELAVALADRVDLDEPSSAIFAYGVGLDLTLRQKQQQAKQQGRPWEASKAFDGSAPLAELTLASQWQPSADKSISLDLDGQRRQTGQLGDMIWSIDQLILTINQSIRLQAGDIILTGTPSGVGKLLAGEHLFGQIEGLTQLNCQVIQQN